MSRDSLADKRRRFPLLLGSLVFLGIAVWFLNHGPSKGKTGDGEVVAEVDSPVETEPTIEAVSARLSVPAASAPIATNIPSGTPSAPRAVNIVSDENAAPKEGRRRLPPGAVPYKLEGNLMIAYGDIVLGNPQGGDAPPSGFAEAPSFKTWKSKEIPFLIAPQVSDSAERIHRVLNYFNENTSIRFIPFKGQKDALIFEPSNDHCRSYLGRVGGHQPIYLSPGCTEPEIAHEIMHALGFIHEQSRPDRDRFIKIHWDRIEPDKADQFDFVPVELASTTEGRPFDYQSVMLYTPSAFARVPGEITIESRTGTPIDPVQTGLSREDLERIDLLYR